MTGPVGTAVPFGGFALTAAGLQAAQASFARCGVAVLGPPAVVPDGFSALRAEVCHQRRLDAWELRSHDGRSRVPEATVRSGLGPVSRAFAGDPRTIAQVRAVVGRPVEPSWAATCTTWYDHPGAWLARHLDHPERCTITVLLGVESIWPAGVPAPPGNQLWVHGSEVSTQPWLKITTRPNRAIVLDGRRWQHERPPLGAGQLVAVLCLCFREPEL